MHLRNATYKLYYSPAACSLAVHAVLNALGAAFELVRTDLDSKDNHAEAYLHLNPLGQVPVLVAGDRVMKESAAIMICLLDNAAHPLLPQKGDARIKAMEWLLFFNSTMHQAYSAHFLIANNIGSATDGVAALQITSRRIQKLWRYVGGQAQTDFLCGDAPTVGDIMMAVIANWSVRIKPPCAIPANVAAMCARVSRLPYVAKAIATEGVTYTIAPDLPV